jgi:hypothetical protein
MNRKIPKAISFLLFFNVHPIQVTGSLLRQMKKRIRLTRARSRRMVANATRAKLKLPCFTAKNERAMDGTIRKRKTETSTSCSPQFDWKLSLLSALLLFHPITTDCLLLRIEVAIFHYKMDQVLLRLIPFRSLFSFGVGDKSFYILPSLPCLFCLASLA